MKILDGRKIATEIKQEIKVEIRTMQNNGYLPPCLAVIIVGDDSASNVYVSSKEKMCKSLGITSSVIRLANSIKEEELLIEVRKLNADDTINGFIVQLPLPKHINEDKIIEAIDSKKDVDGFTPINIGRLVLNLPTLVPATPLGIIELLKRYSIKTESKHCVVIGRSNIVGRPMSILLSQNSEIANATVTLVHSKTKNIEAITKKADIIIAAVGIPLYLKADMVKDNVVIIDVGINRISSDKTKSGYKLVGDVDYDEVAPKSSYITPVPGGIGPMTIIALMMNLLTVYKNHHK